MQANIECETCGRDDVELTQVRRKVWYCKSHIGLFTQHWAINPNLEPFEEEAK